MRSYHYNLLSPDMLRSITWVAVCVLGLAVGIGFLIR